MTMKKILFAACLFISQLTWAQKETGIGIKGGLNYAQNGDLKTAITNAS